MFDLVIRGGTLITAGETVRVDLGITAGRIGAWGVDLNGCTTVSAAGLLVLPGAVDPHVHLEMPTGITTTSDNWASGTLAAACGGTTTVIDFVEPELDQPLLAALKARRAQAEGRANVDYALHMTLPHADAATLAEIPAVVAAGVTSFKTYTTYEGFRLSDAELLAVLQAVGVAGGLTLVHAENDAIIQNQTRALLAAGETQPRAHPLSRPAAAESEAIERALTLAEVAGASIYIVHISTARGAAAVARARARGQAAYGETCPHYLLLTAAEYDRPGFAGAKFVCAPPLRTAEDNTALWQALARHELHTVGSDHCAFFCQQKELGCHDFTQIPGGLPGVEARLALLYTFGVRAGRITPERWVELCCTAPAQRFGLYPRKGTLAPGADADIVLFDPAASVTLSQSVLHERVDYTPYEGLALQGYPVLVFAHGQRLMQAGQFVGPLGQGQFLTRRAGSVNP